MEAVNLTAFYDSIYFEMNGALNRYLETLNAPREVANRLDRVT